PSLGAPWVNQAGAFGIFEKFAVGSGTTPVNVATLAGVAAADVDLSVFAGLGASVNAGLVARYSGPGDKNYYLASLTSDASNNVVARLVRNVNGVITELAVVESVSTDHLQPRLRFRLIGSTLQLFVNENLLATAEDTTFQAGSFGMRSTGGAFQNDFQA